jgi:ParB family chromosome partitioning protein
MEPTNIEPAPKSLYFNNSIFWIELEKIVPNPYQPRREFDPHALRDLADSIRMYGLLQPLTVTRKEKIKEDGGLVVQYELISGERRLRASKLAGLAQVPVIIRSGEASDDARVKLELAIIENLQREDLNAVDRARSFQRLADEFGLKHNQIAEKVGKSREYVSNSIRLLMLPEHMLQALSEKRITEGHTRPLMMLTAKPEEQEVLFKEIIFKKLTVREAEQISRKVAVERARKKEALGIDPETKEFEDKLNQALGTRVMIEKKEKGGKIVIDYFSNDDLRYIIEALQKNQEQESGSGSTLAQKLSDSMTKALSGVDTDSDTAIPGFHPASISVQEAVDQIINNKASEAFVNEVGHRESSVAEEVSDGVNVAASDGVSAVSGENIAGEGELNVADSLSASEANVQPAPIDDSTPADQVDDDELYSMKNFSI